MEKHILKQYTHDQIEQPILNKLPRELSASEKCLISGGSGAAAVDIHFDVVTEVKKVIKGSTLSAGGGPSVVVVEGEPIIKPIPYTNI